MAEFKPMSDAQIRAIEALRLPGPCVICGDTNYGLSMGGPTICPKCDCGHFDGATALKQAQYIARLKEQLTTAITERDTATRRAEEARNEALEGVAKEIEARGSDVGPMDAFDKALVEIINWKPTNVISAYNYFAAALRSLKQPATGTESGND